MPLSVRTRFEVFKRDEFTCRYCARKSPEVVLEVDHIIPRCNGGTDDPVNLATACWDCNRGKSGVSLDRETAFTGEDPYEMAIAHLERERQLKEYNAVVAWERERRENDAWELVAHWNDEQGVPMDPEKGHTIGRNDFAWLMATLKWCPKEIIRDFMDLAIARRRTRGFRYVSACVRNWRAERGLEPKD